MKSFYESSAVFRNGIREKITRDVALARVRQAYVGEVAPAAAPAELPYMVDSVFPYFVDSFRGNSLLSLKSGCDLSMGPLFETWANSASFTKSGAQYRGLLARLSARAALTPDSIRCVFSSDGLLQGAYCCEKMPLAAPWAVFYGNGANAVPMPGPNERFAFVEVRHLLTAPWNLPTATCSEIALRAHGVGSFLLCAGMVESALTPGCEGWLMLDSIPTALSFYRRLPFVEIATCLDEEFAIDSDSDEDARKGVCRWLVMPPEFMAGKLEVVRRALLGAQA